MFFLDLCFLDVGKQCRRAEVCGSVTNDLAHCFQNLLQEDIHLEGELHSGTRTSPLQGCQDSLMGSGGSLSYLPAIVVWGSVQIGQISSAESQSSMIVISPFSCKVYLDEV